MISNCSHVRDPRGHGANLVKEEVPFNQETSCIAYVSNVENGIYTAISYFVGHGFDHRERPRLYTCI